MMLGLDLSDKGNKLQRQKKKKKKTVNTKYDVCTDIDRPNQTPRNHSQPLENI